MSHIVDELQDLTLQKELREPKTIDNIHTERKKNDVHTKI